MAEAKRFSITSTSQSGSNVASTSSGSMATIAAAGASLRFGSDFANIQTMPEGLRGPSTEHKRGSKTIRLDFELFATDSRKYPEFDYTKLLHREKKKIKKLMQKANGFSDPFEENDDDVSRIAKEFENKYGSSYGSVRGRSKKDDQCDIGLGYDESDSFIDNTEAYDEVIPEEVETIEGGFYINSGALEFKKLRTESLTTKTDELIKMPNRPKKRILTSSSDDTSSSEDDSDEAAEEETDGKASSSSGPAEKRLRVVAKPKSLVEKKQQLREGSNSSTAKKKEKAVGLSFSSSNSPKPATDEVASDSEKERNRQKTIKTTTVKDMLKAKRDSFLKRQGGAEPKTMNGEVKRSDTQYSDSDSSDDDSDDSNDSTSNQSAPTVENKAKKGEECSEKLRPSDTKLPELDADVLANIQEFKDAVKSKSISGKKFMFDEKLTEIFLKIDEACLCIEKPQRNMVFAHLEYSLSMPKYYLLRKAKQLRIKEEKLKSKRALAKLRKTIVEAMPNAIAQYEVELRKYADLQSNNVDSDIPPKMPKKKFPWNNNMRNLLYDVYQVRWTSYPVLGTRKESLEDFITSYMKGKVVQLWPNGWMRYEDIQREIEKRKQAAKKNKEKKKDSTAVTTIQSSMLNALPSASCSKQIEELVVGDIRSRTNSDTDSVASSAASLGTKAKGTAKVKSTKSKLQKTNSVPDKLLNQCSIESGKKQSAQTPLLNIFDLTSPPKKTDHSIHSIISSMSPNALSQQLKHSGSTAICPPAAHVINLDNYTSASDILMTSQQLLGAMATAPKIEPSSSMNVKRRESSSESDGVEIVGVYPVKQMSTIGKAKSRKVTNSSQISQSATFTQYSNINMEASTSNYFNSNNNTILKNTKKSATVGLNLKTSIENASNFDVSRVGNVLKELEELQQKHSLTISSFNSSVKEPPNQ